MKKINIETNPEFASEIVLSLPYAYWLHSNNMLGNVSVCKGMKPFYFFADNVTEVYNDRSLDNAQALKDIPNKWLHNSEAGGRRHGVIDYTQWIVPPYKEHYQNKLFEDLKPYVIVNNIYNLEPGPEGYKPYRFFDIQNLYDLFTYFTENGYNVIYKRPENKEFVLDQNEITTNQTNLKITADVEGIGTIDDYELCEYFNGKVINLNTLHKRHNNLDYSTLNLMLFSETEGFVSINGGGSQLCACFDKPLIIYVVKGTELRPNYLEYEDSYIRKMSKATIHPVYDDFEKWTANGGRAYKTLMNTVNQIFKK